MIANCALQVCGKYHDALSDYVESVENSTSQMKKKLQVTVVSMFRALWKTLTKILGLIIIFDFANVHIRVCAQVQEKCVEVTVADLTTSLCYLTTRKCYLTMGSNIQATYVKHL
jgi:hypothetical protein